MGRNDYIVHYGRSRSDGAPHGSGRYPLGSGKDPYQHGSLRSAHAYKHALNNLDNERAKYQARADKANLKVNATNSKANKLFNKAVNSSDFDGTNLGENLNTGKLGKVREQQRKHEANRNENQAKADEIQSKIDSIIKDAEDSGYDVSSKEMTRFGNQGGLFIAQVIGGLPAGIGFYAATAKYNNQEGKRYSVKKGDALKEVDAKSQADFDGDRAVATASNKMTDLANKDTNAKDLSDALKSSMDAISKQNLSKQAIRKSDGSSSSQKDAIKNINTIELHKKDSNGYYKGVDRKVSFDGGKTDTFVNMDVTTGQMSRDKNGKVHETLASDEQIKDYQKRSNNYLNSLADAKNNEKLRDKIADAYYEKAWVNDDPKTKITRDEFKKNLTINSIGIDPNHNNVTVFWDDGGSYYGHSFAYSTKLDGSAADIDKYGISLEG